jgi:hypothetical protein
MNEINEFRDPDLVDTGVDAVLDAPLGLSPEEGCRVTALMLATKYHTETIVKDAQLYNALKMDGKELTQSSTMSVVKIAAEFEHYIRHGLVTVEAHDGDRIEVILERKP